MSVSKKVSKKTNSSSKIIDKRIYYAFILLFLANIIVFTFFGYFIFRLLDNQINAFNRAQINVSPVPKLVNESQLEVSAVSFIVYDPLTRSTILSKNPNIRLSPASSIKILTALVSLDYYKLDDFLFGVGASYDESRMGLSYGEQISVENLIYGLLLISGNDAAKTLSSNYPGGSEKFVEDMNKKAQELGLLESNFVDPSGYMDSNYSTAFEMARLGGYAMENNFIREVVDTQQKIVYDRYGMVAHPLKNLNELLIDSNVNGIKTGFTNEAGGVLITSYIHDRRELIIVVMKSEDRFLDTQRIINEIKNNVIYSDVSSAD